MENNFVGLDVRNMQNEVMFKAAASYFSQVNDLRRYKREMGNLLEEPKLHRMQELFAHSVPLFGNINKVGEMLLECYHKVLKSGISGNNHDDAHIRSI